MGDNSHAQNIAAQLREAEEDDDLPEDLRRRAGERREEIEADLDELCCEVCGCDLTDPKNAGDPDVDGDWVCRDPTCRAAHRTEMECNGCHLAPDGGGE